MGLDYAQLPERIKKLVAQAGYRHGQAPANVKKKGVPNTLEKKFYADYIAPKELTGEWTDVGYETETFPLAHKLTYTPDYMARDKNGQRIAMEVKARHRHFDKGWQKAKFFATAYPNIKLLFAEVKKGEWDVKEVPAMIRRRADVPELPQDDE